jgi:hypothetical protein
MPYKTMNPTTEKIKAAAEGLLFMSESDYPLEVFEPQLQPTGQITDDLLLQWAGKPAGTAIEKTDLAYFFRNQVRDLPEHGPAEKQRAERFRKLQQLLQEELSDATVYRIGNIQVTAMVIGKTKTGEYTGLKTTLIET